MPQLIGTSRMTLFPIRELCLAETGTRETKEATHSLNSQQFAANDDGSGQAYTATPIPHNLTSAILHPRLVPISIS
jgi:hypothetical protein